MSEEEFEALHEEMETQRQELREALADDLGGEPEDDDASNYLADRTGETLADGGE